MTDLKYPDKSRGVAIALAYFLGLFGVHRFYLGETKKGLIYLVLFWTTIPIFLGFWDGFKYFRNPEWFSEPVTTEVESQTSGGESQASGGGESLPAGAVMSATGANGKVTLYDDRLEISREGIGMIHKMQHGFKGDKEIPYDSITSIQLRKPSNLSRGYIQFGQSGFSESDDGLLDATGDENTVLFDKGDLSDFEELREKVRELKKGDVEESTGSMDGALEKLRERYAEGDIDEEEYEQRKEILQEG
ncbi:NINE protein [Halobacterium salinarum]|uniref:NINE protein n=1 Tax=Halobacterium salinarum TaxID=2242 RepID=UPI0025562E05|nr:NINE protein [Halobacterium salinarum]MDL0144396.1 NINE protein [Halobacterium salinarum]